MVWLLLRLTSNRELVGEAELRLAVRREAGVGLDPGEEGGHGAVVPAVGGGPLGVEDEEAAVRVASLGGLGVLLLRGLGRLGEGVDGEEAPEGGGLDVGLGAGREGDGPRGVLAVLDVEDGRCGVSDVGDLVASREGVGDEGRVLAVADLREGPPLGEGLLVGEAEAVGVAALGDEALEAPRAPFGVVEGPVVEVDVARVAAVLVVDEPGAELGEVGAPEGQGRDELGEVVGRVDVVVVEVGDDRAWAGKG